MRHPNRVTQNRYLADMQRVKNMTFVKCRSQEITIPTVNVERTFLEKVFLLHEEYQRPVEKRRVERLSRHLYDIEKISQTPYFQKALSDKNLYTTIVAHRAKFSHLSGIDYTKHEPKFINIIPPESVLLLWKKDYVEMSESMIYNEKLSFKELIDNLKQVNNKINRMNG